MLRRMPEPDGPMQHLACCPGIDSHVDGRAIRMVPPLIRWPPAFNCGLVDCITYAGPLRWLGYCEGLPIRRAGWTQEVRYAVISDAGSEYLRSGSMNVP